MRAIKPKGKWSNFLLGITIFLCAVWLHYRTRSCFPFENARLAESRKLGGDFYVGRALSEAVPFRLAKINQAGVEFVIAVEPNPGDYLSDQLLQHGSWEADQSRVLGSIAQEKLKRQSKCLFVDVGANQGIHSLYMAKIGCKVVAFEMQKRVAALMQTSLFLNNLQDKVEIVNHPVNEESKTLYYIENAANLGGTSLSGASPEKPGSIQVESVRIDSFVKEKADIVKMDIEGSEYQALRSMSNLLDYDLVGDLLVEIWGASIPQVDYLYERGYAAHRLNNLASPISRESLEEILNELKSKGGYEDFLFRK